MKKPTQPRLAGPHMTDDDRVPEVVYQLAARDKLELVWQNQLGGLTFRFADRYVKWNPRSNGIDLDRERQRLDWMSGSRSGAGR